MLWLPRTTCGEVRRLARAIGPPNRKARGKKRRTAKKGISRPREAVSLTMNIYKPGRKMLGKSGMGTKADRKRWSG